MALCGSTFGMYIAMQDLALLDCTAQCHPMHNTCNMRRFVERIDALLKRASNASEALHVVVVGGGAGGVEVAFALQHRMQTDKSLNNASSTTTTTEAPVPTTGASASAAKHHKVSIFTRSKILSSHPPKARAIILALAEERDITIHEGAGVSSMSNYVLTTENGESVPFDECLWCTQAVPAQWLKHVDLPKRAHCCLASHTLVHCSMFVLVLSLRRRSCQNSEVWDHI